MSKLHETVHFKIPLNPRTKKNNMQPRLGRGGKFLGMMQSDIYQQYERDCLMVIPQKVRKMIDYPVNVKAHYYRESLIKVDKCNLENALLDILVKAGVLVDDSALSPSIVISTDGSRVFLDRKNPRTEIWIEPLEDEPYQVKLNLVEDF